MTDEFDDILGGGKPGPTYKPGRPTKEQAEAKKAELAAMGSTNGGVSINWLAQAFRMSRNQVETALSACPVLRNHPNGGKIYDLKVAAAYLVEPKREMTQVLKNLKASDLPEHLRETFWNAKTKEMKFRLLAGELWPTESVMEVLADTFQTISGKTKLWVDDLEELGELSEKQRKALLAMVDDLLTEVRKGLIERAESKFSESYAAELDQ